MLLTKADISQHRQHWQWCTFFTPVYFLALRTQNFGYFVANLRTFGCTEIDRYIRYAPPCHIITTLQFSKLISNHLPIRSLAALLAPALTSKQQQSKEPT